MFKEVGLVGAHLRGDRFYGEVVSSTRAILTVRSEIGPYRRPSQRVQLADPAPSAIVRARTKEPEFAAQVAEP
jgi:hypothetical protein